MKKLIFGMFLLAGTTLGFAKNLDNANITIKSTNKASFEKLINIKGLNIDSLSYDDNGKCTVKASYNNGSSSGTISVTAATCSAAMATIAMMLNESGL